MSFDLVQITLDARFPQVFNSNLSFSGYSDICWDGTPHIGTTWRRGRFSKKLVCKLAPHHAQSTVTRVQVAFQYTGKLRPLRPSCHWFIGLASLCQDCKILGTISCGLEHIVLGTPGLASLRAHVDSHGKYYFVWIPYGTHAKWSWHDFLSVVKQSKTDVFEHAASSRVV